jgi:hypothetical protein
VFPDRRNRGLARRALDALREVLTEHDLGLKLDTSWCWPRNVEYYLRLGMWLRMWKRELQFTWSPDVPPPILQVGQQRAAISIEVDGVRREIHHAERDGDRLIYEPRFEDDDRVYNADTTFALALAIHGWPLIRSERAWNESYWADAGPPEALAYKITIWEAWSRKHGWLVETPRIPGLEYPTWAELEARWQSSE